MAKSTKTTPTAPSAPARPRRSAQRSLAEQRRRNLNRLVIAGAVTFALLIALVIYMNIRSQQPVAGEEKFAAQGSFHMEDGSVSPVAYNSIPPTSGPHYSNLAAWQSYSTPQRYEVLLHNLEDGGVIVYYQCADACPETVQQLGEIVDPYRRAGRKVILTPNQPGWQVNNSQPLHQDMGAPIAVVTWQRLLKLNTVDGQKIRAFIDRYEGIDHHGQG